MDKMYIYHPEKGVMIGIPARDMTQEEWDQCPKEWTKSALAQGLYTVEKPVSKEVKHA